MTKTEIEQKLLELTGDADVESALQTLSEMVRVVNQLKHVGMVCMLISPAGVMQTLISDRLMGDAESMSVLQKGLLEFQSNLVNAQGRILAEQKKQADLVNKKAN